MAKHHLINVSPFATNALDLVGRKDLQTPDGRAITVKRSMADFVIVVDGESKPFVTDDNITASRYLNSFEVGTK